MAASMTTIQVSEDMVERLRRAKQDMGVGTYEDVLERLLRQREVLIQAPKRRGSRPGLRWNRETDRMKFRTEE